MLVYENLIDLLELETSSFVEDYLIEESLPAVVSGYTWSFSSVLKGRLLLSLFEPE